MRKTVREQEAIESSYKTSISKRIPYVYRDSDWLVTDMTMPAWSEYRQQISSLLPVSLAQRRQLNQIYYQLLPEQIRLSDAYQTWRFHVRLKNRDATLRAIFADGFFASAHYASLPGIIGTGEAPQAVRLAEEVINLFNDHHFTASQAEQVCQIILETLP